mmetsp:Transcript_25662/g.85670  ORF Transcript_25662/g.85670 Transcript_25662/m.85670 type:complete len:345 (-) Transcript_25662:380-1414(-)
MLSNQVLLPQKSLQLRSHAAVAARRLGQPTGKLRIDPREEACQPNQASPGKVQPSVEVPPAISPLTLGRLGTDPHLLLPILAGRRLDDVAARSPAIRVRTPPHEHGPALLPRHRCPGPRRFVQLLGTSLGMQLPLEWQCDRVRPERASTRENVNAFVKCVQTDVTCVQQQIHLWQWVETVNDNQSLQEGPHVRAIEAGTCPRLVAAEHTVLSNLDHAAVSKPIRLHLPAQRGPRVVQVLPAECARAELPPDGRLQLRIHVRLSSAPYVHRVAAPAMLHIDGGPIPLFVARKVSRLTTSTFIAPHHRGVDGGACPRPYGDRLFQERSVCTNGALQIPCLIIGHHR